MRMMQKGRKAICMKNMWTERLRAAKSWKVATITSGDKWKMMIEWKEKRKEEEKCTFMCVCVYEWVNKNWSYYVE